VNGYLFAKGCAVLGVTQKLQGRRAMSACRVSALLTVFVWIAGTAAADGYRWRHDNGGETNASWMAAENTAITNVARGQNIRVRFTISNTSTGPYYLEPSGLSKCWFYYSASPSGPWREVGTNAAEAVCMAQSPHIETGTATTDQLGGSATFAAGHCVEAPDTVGPTMTLDTDRRTEFEYCFQLTAKAVGAQTYYLKLYKGYLPVSAVAVLTVEPGELEEPPHIHSPLTAQIRTGLAWTYSIHVSGSQPVSNGVANLPSWLLYNSDRESISGQPTETGAFDIHLSASNPYGTDTQTLVVTVEGNIPPTANDQTQAVNTLSYQRLDLEWSDPDDPIDSMKFRLVTAPSHGVLKKKLSTETVMAEGDWSYNDYFHYTPNDSYAGPDSFVWDCWDSAGNTSRAATFTVNVAAAAPVAEDRTVTAGTNRTTKLPAMYSDADSRASLLRISIVSGPSHGTAETASAQLYYTPAFGYTGPDSFTWEITDGIHTSDVATCTINVTDTPPGGTNTLIVVVKDTLLPEIEDEVNRLLLDLQWEGRAVKLKSWSSTSTRALWDYLVAEYNDASQNLEGAILIGQLPEIKSTSGETADVAYWNMETYENGLTHHIWVSRFRGVVYAFGSQFGNEVAMQKRALDANHYCRTGASRLPHTGTHYDVVGGGGNIENLRDVWPGAVWRRPGDAFRTGADLIHETSHGNAGSYDDWGVTEDGIHNTIAQARFALCSSCGSGAPGRCVNNQLVTRYGGNVLSIGASETSYIGAFVILRDYAGTWTKDKALREMLAAGHCWGVALRTYHSFGDKYRSMFYGDLSLPVMPTMSNKLPAINTLTASKTTLRVGEPVTLTVTVSDQDAGATDSPFVDFEHRVDWYLNGWNYGRNNPVYTTDSTQSNWTQVAHSYASTGTRTVRALVMDEWRAVGYKDIEISVISDPPAAADDTADTDENTAVVISVLDNDSDPNGDSFSVSSVAAPAHGTATTDGTNVTYTPHVNWHGTDSFTYTLRDAWNYTDTAVVTVTVNPVSTPPEAVDDETFALPGQVTVINVLGNDRDWDGAGLSVHSVTDPADGVAFHNEQTVSYIPDPGFEGTNTFEYQLIDGVGRTASATVTVTVTPVPDTVRGSLFNPAYYALSADALVCTNGILTFYTDQGVASNSVTGESWTGLPSVTNASGKVVLSLFCFNDIHLSNVTVRAEGNRGLVLAARRDLTVAPGVTIDLAGRNGTSSAAGTGAAGRRGSAPTGAAVLHSPSVQRALCARCSHLPVLRS
jgi:hypothetical protein